MRLATGARLKVALLWAAAGLLPAGAAEFYVSTAGSDTHPGTLEKPFATVQRAQAAAAPGDTVFIRGGTYALTESQIARRERAWAYVTFLDKSGKPGARINYWAYPRERPVFDCAAVRPPLRVDAFYVCASWVHLKGLEVIGVQVTQTNHTQSIAFENDGSHNIFEALSIHDGQAIGVYSVRGSDNLFLNCDAWNNWDRTSEDGLGGNVDGFGCHPRKGGTNNVFRGCRAWLNSDDGFDCIGAHEAVTFERCWAFKNGYSAEGRKLRDGNGFKVGGFGSTPLSRLPAVIPRQTVRFCLAVRNKANGFYANHHLGGSDWFNNTASRNGQNFNMLGRLADNRSDVPGYGHVMRNNVSHGASAGVANLDASKCDVSHNAMDAGEAAVDADFSSLDESELTGPRQPDGELPVLRFLTPSNGGRLIDKGLDVGLPYRGAAPDLGAFEAGASGAAACGPF